VVGVARASDRLRRGVAERELERHRRAREPQLGAVPPAAELDVRARRHRRARPRAEPQLRAAAVERDGHDRRVRRELGRAAADLEPIARGVVAPAVVALERADVPLGARARHVEPAADAVPLAGADVADAELEQHVAAVLEVGDEREALGVVVGAERERLEEAAPGGVGVDRGADAEGKRRRDCDRAHGGDAQIA
jgi:hypothetical protein